jgi:RHS repeat-associated protein
LTTYDIDDHPIYVTDANGVTVTNTYDILHRLSTRTYPDGGVERFGYSERGLVAYTNQLNFVTYYGYDEARRKLCETNANNEVIRYTNNAAGDLLALVDGKNQVTKWKYDEYGRVTNKLDQAGAEIFRYKYDPNNRLTNRWTPAKGDTKYKYDTVGNLTNVDYSVSTDVQFRYDPMNRLTNMVDALGTTKYTYTAGGQLRTEDGPYLGDTLTNIYYHRVRVNLDLQQPTGVWTNAYTYDAAKRLYSVKSRAGYFEYQYRDGLAGTLVQKIFLPNTSYITNTYDQVARMLFTKLNKSDDTTLDAALYGYNTGNQRTTFTNVAGTFQSFRYDAIGQLKVARSTNSSGAIVSGESRGYAYDTAWNLNWRTNAIWSDEFTVDSKNQMVAAASESTGYDANGNLTYYALGPQNFTYDDENRLVAWEQETDFRCELIYDGAGRLRKRTEYIWDFGDEDYQWVWQSETLYLYDGMRVIQERNASNVPTVSYTRGSDLGGSLEGAGGIGGLLARSHGYSLGNWSTHNYYHADGNGNITYLMTSAQGLAASYRYDPYGNTLNYSGSLAGANAYRFSSKEYHSNSEFYYYGYRWYAPSLQRWLNRDPLGERGGINLYGFVGNKPVGFIDPDGRQFYEPPILPPSEYPPVIEPAHMGYPDFASCFQWCMGMMNPFGLPQGGCIATSIVRTGAPAAGAASGAGWLLGVAAGCALNCL